ncbi:MAG: hypothetical protein ABJN39_09345 [Sulfitobacter sp.]|uniref:hypothetical protein n=1 Tax=Alphaproteobacteria TaxID=28211 RepID=UPI002942913F|nr:hypothetical protein [Sulfitobacter sp. LC.270.F.C4]WOI13579.1 hypothetical protein R1T45_01745 [Sulfitobacter sp. LC.270.F.C4]
MSAGTDIAAEVLAGLEEAGEATGNEPMICTLRRPAADGPTDPWGGGGSGPTYHEVTAVQTQKHIRDASGTLIGETRTVLLVDATGVTPLKSDYVAVNLRIADVTSDTRFHEIADAETVAPAGVALMHKVTLAD